MDSGEQIGDWIVERPLGAGGMGAVYLCRNRMTDRIRAAVKVVASNNLDADRPRFVREVEALNALRHPAIVRVIGWGEDAAQAAFFIAMELVDGMELGDRMAQGPMPPEEARRLFLDLAQGLEHAHARGIFHRDLKPANVLLTNDGEIRLVDFGIAVQDGRTRLTRAGLVAGTPAYMAPESFDGAVLDPSAIDAYGLGQMLCEALTGDVAFPENDTLSPSQRVMAVMGSKLRTDRLDPGEGCPEPLRAVVLAATEQDPKARMRIPDIAAALKAMAPLAATGDGTTWVSTPAAAPRPPSGGDAVVSNETVNWDLDAEEPVAPPPPVAPAPPPVPHTPPPVAAAPPARRGWLGLVVAGGLFVGVAAIAVVGLSGAGVWWWTSQEEPPPPPEPALAAPEPEPSEPEPIVEPEPAPVSVPRAVTAPRPTPTPTPAPAPAAPAPAPAAPAPVAPEPVAPEPVAPEPVASGDLRLFCTGGSAARVSIDGGAPITTPAFVPLTAGTHTFELEVDGTTTQVTREVRFGNRGSATLDLCGGGRF